MKMPDALPSRFNCHIATVACGQIVIPVQAEQSGSDRGLIRPMLDQLRRRYLGAQRHLVDGASQPRYRVAAAAASTSTATDPQQHKTDPYAPRASDQPGRCLRRPMKSPHGKGVYKRRSMANASMRAATAASIASPFTARQCEHLLHCSHSQTTSWPPPTDDDSRLKQHPRRSDRSASLLRQRCTAGNSSSLNQNSIPSQPLRSCEQRVSKEVAGRSVCDHPSRPCLRTLLRMTGRKSLSAAQHRPAKACSFARPSSISRICA